MRALVVVLMMGCSGASHPGTAGSAAPADAPGTLRLTPHVSLRVPPEARPAPAKSMDQHRYDLENESFLLLVAIDETGAGGCPKVLDKQYARMSGESQVRVDELAWRTTLGRKSMYAVYGVRAPDAIHPHRSLQFCDGDTLVGITVGARTELSASDNATFDAVVGSLR